MALLGVADDQGYFGVQDVCLAGIPFKAQLPGGVAIEEQKKELFDDDLL